ncbi:MAG: hypothetical protein QXD95_05720 [Nitrososphaeria archaeon]
MLEELNATIMGKEFERIFFKAIKTESLIPAILSYIRRFILTSISAVVMLYLLRKTFLERHPQSCFILAAILVSSTWFILLSQIAISRFLLVTGLWIILGFSTMGSSCGKKRKSSDITMFLVILTILSLLSNVIPRIYDISENLPYEHEMALATHLPRYAFGKQGQVIFADLYMSLLLTYKWVDLYEALPSLNIIHDWYEYGYIKDMLIKKDTLVIITERSEMRFNVFFNDSLMKMMNEGRSNIIYSSMKANMILQN